MYFIKAIPVVITRIFARRVIDRLMSIAPFFQASVDIVFIGQDQTADLNGLFQNGLDCFLLDIGQQVENHLPIALDHPQNRGLFTLQRAASPLAL